jgi:hypothetical protein
MQAGLVVGGGVYCLGMSNSSSGIRRHPVGVALSAVDEALVSTRDAAVWALADDELDAALDRCQQVAARVAELSLRLVAEADGRDLGRRAGASSTAAWLRGRFRVRSGEAWARVELANRIAAAAEAPVDFAANVGSARSGREMPATGAALAAGAVSEQHALVIAKAMRRLPGTVDAAVCAEAERQLAELAGQFDPGELAKLADSLVEALSPDTLADDEDDAVNRRELRLSEHTGQVSGRLDPEALAMVRAMLDPLAVPQPGEDGEKDDRSPARRLADALVEIARRVLNQGDWLPAGHGARSHLNLVTQLDPDDDGDPTGGGPDSDFGPGEDSIGGGVDENGPEGGDAGVAPRADAGDGDDRDTASPGADGRGRWVRLGRGELSWGRPLSAAAVDRIACDAGIRWIITDPAGVPLNVGREQRTVTPGQWAALIVRDGGCVFPGCTRPVEWCEAHHIWWWRFGGPTDLDNLCLLCAAHHRTVHHGGWNIQLGKDRNPEFIPPAWVDPEQTPRRNNRPRHHRKKPTEP